MHWLNLLFQWPVKGLIFFLHSKLDLMLVSLVTILHGLGMATATPTANVSPTMMIQWKRCINGFEFNSLLKCDYLMTNRQSKWLTQKKTAAKKSEYMYTKNPIFQCEFEFRILPQLNRKNSKETMESSFKFALELQGVSKRCALLCLQTLSIE